MTVYAPIVTPWEALSIKTEDPWCQRSQDLLQDHMVASNADMQIWIDALVKEAYDDNETCLCEPGYKGATLSAMLSMPEDELLSMKQVEEICYWYS